MQLSQNAKEALESARTPSCSKCFHFQVCIIAKTLPPILANSFPPIVGSEESDTTSPINPDDMAKICKAYVPTTSVITK